VGLDPALRPSGCAEAASPPRVGGLHFSRNPRREPYRAAGSDHKVNLYSELPQTTMRLWGTVHTAGVTAFSSGGS